ncbi:MAG: insulinase family protein [Spirochaetaceae bacterium]|jgi:zinc protease|nr:insulinase family protein [Spirochaetaceae bacterium]
MAYINNHRHFCRLFAFFVFVLLLAGNPIFAADGPLFVLPQRAVYGGLGGPDDLIPAKAALRSGKLPNGLRYYILENSLPAGRAYLTLAVDAGSVLENDDEQGLAHFTEHMAFSGTRRFPGAELVNYLRSLGMRFGPEVNAYTSFDKTVYGIETPVERGTDGIKRIPERALAILDDWSWAVSFNPEDVDKERLIVMEEYRARLGAQERIWRQAWPVICRGSPYAQRFPIGLPEIIQNAPAERLKDFYRRWYRTDNMAVILVGDFDGAALERDLAAHFSAPAPDAPLNRPRYDLPEPQKGALTSAVITDPEMPASIVYLYYKRSPRSQDRTLRSYRDGLVEYLAETMIDFRFNEMIAAGATPYMGTGTWNDRHGYSSRYYVMAAQAKVNGGAETLEALLLEKERLARYGVTHAELERAKRAILSDLEMIEAEKDRQESEMYVGDLCADFLGERFAMDSDWELNAVECLLPAIGLQTVNAAIQSFFADDDLTVIIAAPETEAAGLPDEKAIAALVSRSSQAEIAPPETKAAALSPVSKDPVPGAITSVRQDESGAEIWELSNGMRLILVETANKNNELDFYALARGGTTSAGADGALMQGCILDGLGFSPDEARFSAELAPEIQSASGLGALSRAELLNFLSGKQVSLSFWAGDYARGIRGSSAVRDLPVLFQLLHALFVQPRIDQTGLTIVLDRYRTKLLQEADNPDVVFSKELMRLIYNNHPLFRPMEVKDLNQVNGTAAMAFLTVALNPADYTLVMAGSLGDRENLRRLAETWLASIPVGELPRWNEWARPEIWRSENAEKFIFKGKEDKSLVYQGWRVPKTWTGEDNAAVLVLNEYLDIVLTDEIREAMGGVYSVSAHVSLTPTPVGELSLGVYFVCSPARQDELRKAIRSRLASLAEGGIDAETFSRAKEALVKTFERALESNDFIARNLAHFAVITGTPLSHFAQRPALYRSVTAEQVQRIVSELLTVFPIELVLLPEAAGE